MNHDDNIEPDRDHARDAAADGCGGLPDTDLMALSAFVDGELLPGDESAVHAKLADDPLAAKRVFAYCAQKSALRALCRASAADPAPAPYLVLRARDPWWWRFGMAAGWCVAGAGVALAAAALVPHVGAGGSGDSSGGGAVGFFAADEPDAFARHADVAYAVYTPEQRHPV